MVAWASQFVKGFIGGATVGGGLSVVNSAAGSAFENKAVDPYSTAKEKIAKGEYGGAALSAGHALLSMAGSIGAAVGTYMGASTLLTAGAVALLGTTALPVAATVGIMVGATLLASGAASAVGTLVQTGSLTQAAKAGVNGVVNPLPLVGVHLSGMGKSVDPPWFNVLGIPEYIKAHSGAAPATSPPTVAPTSDDRQAAPPAKTQQGAQLDGAALKAAAAPDAPAALPAAEQHGKAPSVTRTSRDYAELEPPAKTTPALPVKAVSADAPPAETPVAKAPATTAVADAGGATAKQATAPRRVAPALNG